MLIDNYSFIRRSEGVFYPSSSDGKIFLETNFSTFFFELFSKETFSLYSVNYAADKFWQPLKLEPWDSHQKLYLP